MKRLLLGTAALLVLGVGLAPTASAYTGAQDSRYLFCLARGWGHPSVDPVGSINWGHRIADAISSGDTPLGDRDYLYLHSDIDSTTSANVMINCATSIYLGFGPPVMS